MKKKTEIQWDLGTNVRDSGTYKKYKPVQSKYMCYMT